MSVAPRFQFNQDFAAGPASERSLGVSRAEHEELLAAKAASSFREGFAAGQAESSAQAQQRLAAAMAQIAAGLTRAAASFGDVQRRVETEAVETALVMATKLASELLAREPVATIAALARQCLANVLETPHLAVRVSGSLVPEAQARLSPLAADMGFAGRLIVTADPTLAEGDCRIEWADGAVVRNRAQLESKISAAVDRYLRQQADPNEFAGGEHHD